MNGIPDGVDVGNFVSKEFDCVEYKRNSENPWMREDLQGSRQVDNLIALKKTESRNGGIKIEAGGKSGTEREAKSL